MRSRGDSETVRFSAKGRVVIPQRLRREYHIEEGTRAVVTATPNGILIKPVTTWAIEQGFGLLKRHPRGKSFEAEWTRHKREERELEQRKFTRRTGSR